MIHTVSELLKMGLFSGKVTILSSDSISLTTPCVLLRGQIIIVHYDNQVMATSTFRRANTRRDTFICDMSSLRPINNLLGSYGLEFHPQLTSSLSKRISLQEFTLLH